MPQATSPTTLTLASMEDQHIGLPRAGPLKRPLGTGTTTLMAGALSGKGPLASTACAPTLTSWCPCTRRTSARRWCRPSTRNATSPCCCASRWTRRTASISSPTTVCSRPDIPPPLAQNSQAHLGTLPGQYTSKPGARRSPLTIRAGGLVGQGSFAELRPGRQERAADRGGHAQLRLLCLPTRHELFCLAWLSADHFRICLHTNHGSQGSVTHCDSAKQTKTAKICPSAVLRGHALEHWKLLSNVRRARRRDARQHACMARDYLRLHPGDLLPRGGAALYAAPGHRLRPVLHKHSAGRL